MGKKGVVVVVVVLSGTVALVEVEEVVAVLLLTVLLIVTVVLLEMVVVLDTVLSLVVLDDDAVELVVVVVNSSAQHRIAAPLVVSTLHVGGSLSVLLLSPGAMIWPPSHSVCVQMYALSSLHVVPAATSAASSSAEHRRAPWLLHTTFASAYDQKSL